MVKRSGAAEADALLAEVIGACGAENARPDRRVIMDDREIREMHGAGMTIGAHTVSHYNLTCLEPDEVAREVRESRVFLEGVVGDSVEHMAYPDGRTGRHFDGGVARVAKEQGLRSAVTSIAGPASSAYSVFAIPRLGVVPSHSRLERLAYDMQYRRLWGPRDDVFDEVRAATGIDGGS
jgi:peptidoglycan/xylan/chitin deacetylase (PgdA/CDA1 family)